MNKYIRAHKEYDGENQHDEVRAVDSDKSKNDIATTNG